MSEDVYFAVKHIRVIT